MSRYQKGKTNLDFAEARDSEWQWHQLGRMQVCSSLQTDNHASTPPLSFLQAGCPSCRPTNSVKALKAHIINSIKSAEHQTYWRGLKARAEKEEGAEGGSAEGGRPHSQQKKIGQCPGKSFSRNPTFLCISGNKNVVRTVTVNCNTDVPRGSVATYSRCGGIPSNYLTANSPQRSSRPV